MSYINYNPTAQQGFQNALSMGMQMGAQARQAREEKEYKNALAQFDPSNPESLKPIMAIRPEVGLKLQGQVEQRQAQQREADLTRRAMAGDDDALGQLATVNFDRWNTLSADQRKAIEEENKLYGNAAMDVLNLPPAQRAQAIMGYANRFNSPEIAAIADMPPQEQEAALRAAVAEAQMTEKLIAMERPNYMAIPQGGTLVDTRNPQAVQQFGQQGGPPPQITGEADYNALPPGTEYIDPQGNRRVKGGTASNGGGGFPTGQ